MAPLKVCISTIIKGGVLVSFLVIRTDIEYRVVATKTSPKFEEETEWFATHFNFFKPQALNMIIEITKFLEKAENEYDGITVLGV